MSTSTASSATKRKRAPPSYYGVRTGFNPGVYYSWTDVQKQINGFKGAQYKKFSTLAEAEDFMAGKSAPMKAGGKTKHYAVLANGTSSIFTDWPTAQTQIKGVKGVKFKSFPTREDAQAWIASEGVGRSAASTPYPGLKEDAASEASFGDARKGCKVGDNTSKKQKKNDGLAAATAFTNGDYEPGTGPLLADAEDGFDRRIFFNPDSGYVEYKSDAQLEAQKLQPTGEFDGPIEIYTDGSSMGNGKAGAVAGVGVYFGPNDPRNLSEPLPGPRQTNQRAELTAIQRALDTSPIDRPVTIYSDSQYAINCVTAWFSKWRGNDWHNTAGKPVENKEIIEAIIDRIEERHLAKAETRFVKVKGHSGGTSREARGNDAADRLATDAAREAGSVVSFGESFADGF